MGVDLILILVGFIIIQVYAFWRFFTDDRIMTFFLLLASSIMFFSNCFILVYQFGLGGKELFSYIEPEYLIKGITINLVFIIVWVLGYELCSPIKIRILKEKSFVEDQVALFSWLVCMGAFFWHYKQGYAYGHATQLYTNNPAEAGSFGLIGGLKILFLALTTSLLLTYYRRKKADELTGFYSKKWLFYVFWGVLISAIFIGLVIDNQRGDAVKPLLMIIVIVLINGFNKKRIIGYGVGVVLILFLVSPILDVLRVDETGTDSLALAQSVVESNEQFSMDESSGVLNFALTYYTYEIARKSAVASTSASLAEYADTYGPVHFRTYPSILFEFTPRMILNSKPIPISIDGTYEGTARALASREAGLTNIWWDSGGGILYWQFSWWGVIIGGFLVGGLWKIFISMVFNSNDIFSKAIFLSSISWGLTLLGGLDNFLLDFVRGIKLIFPFLAIYLFFSIVRFSKRRKLA
ncbi:MAG: hypothetical protein HEP71_28025 [Roseivirga sp.]|nr:hypothetical protein [Roseivirga sp.]